MANRKGGFIGQDGLNAPDEPTNVSASGDDSSAEVSFTAPTDQGGAAVSGYRVTDSTGAHGASGSSSPITVTGLTNGSSYTFRVWAINPFGWSSPSDASGSVTPEIPDYGVFMTGQYFSSPYTTNTIDYVAIATTGNATDWGDATQSRSGGGPVSNSIRGICGGGNNPTSPSGNFSRIDYITFASKGNASIFGSLTVGRYYRVGGVSNDTRGVFVAGRNSSSNGTNVMDYVTIATTGNATDFGDYYLQLRNGPSGCSSTTRGVLAGGRDESNNVYNNIAYLTIATTGNVSDFGDLSSTSDRQGAASNGTRGIFFGVGSSSTSIRYVTIATTGNTTNFGSLTVTTSYHESTSNKTRAITANSDGLSGQLDYVTMATTGNATTFGNLSFGRYASAAVGSAHGGLA